MSDRRGMWWHWIEKVWARAGRGSCNDTRTWNTYLLLPVQCALHIPSKQCTRHSKQAVNWSQQANSVLDTPSKQCTPHSKQPVYCTLQANGVMLTPSKQCTVYSKQTVYCTLQANNVLNTPSKQCTAQSKPRVYCTSQTKSVLHTPNQQWTVYSKAQRHNLMWGYPSVTNCANWAKKHKNSAFPEQVLCQYQSFSGAFQERKQLINDLLFQLLICI